MSLRVSRCMNVPVGRKTNSCGGVGVIVEIEAGVKVGFSGVGVIEQMK